MARKPLYGVDFPKNRPINLFVSIDLDNLGTILLLGLP
jgi:hypothetical protein